MSIVPLRGLLRKHFEEAVKDIEYKSSAFWQAYFQRAFNEVDKYSVTCESSPDESRRRVDMVVQKYDSDNHTFTAMIWVECKRPSGSIREVELQALDAAQRYMRASPMERIFVTTTVGVKFRNWVLTSGNPDQLDPLHGTLVFADRHQYIHADTDAAFELTKMINKVKEYPPLREAPVVPSQPVEDFPVSYTNPLLQVPVVPSQLMGDFPVSSYADAGESSYTVESLYEGGSWQQQSYNNTEQGKEDGQVDQETFEVGAAESRGSRAKFMEVAVTKVRHLISADEFKFRDSKGHTRSTLKSCAE